MRLKKVLDTDKKEGVFLREVLNGKNFYDVKISSQSPFIWKNCINTDDASRNTQRIFFLQWTRVKNRWLQNIKQLSTNLELCTLDTSLREVIWVGCSILHANIIYLSIQRHRYDHKSAFKARGVYPLLEYIHVQQR